MINVHHRLTEAFNSLPNIGAIEASEGITPFDGFKPNYKWGDELHLNQLMKSYSDSYSNPYPLIYNVSNTNEQDTKRNTATYNKLSLVLATRNIHTEYKNTQRWETSYKNILFPLAKNIEILFSKSQIFLWDGAWEPFEFPNYGNNKENETTDIWDALRFDTKITINNNCFKPLKY